MNVTSMSLNVATPVSFVAQWLDYRGLSQVWFTENSTGSASTPLYNNTAGASTYWCNRTYTLTLTSGTLVQCIMYANNTLGETASATLYIYTHTALVAGWNNFTAWVIDVNKTFGQVSASLAYGNIGWTVVTVDYLNGTQWSLQYGTTYNANCTVTSGSKLWLFCTDETATWNHAY